MGIIGIFAAGLLYLINPLGQIQKANDAKRKSDLEQLQRTLEVYYNDNGKYPAHSTILPTYRLNPPTGVVDWGTSWTAYNTTLPKDPTPSTRTYVYFASLDGQSYWLYASLEKTNDPQICTGINNDGECSKISSNIVGYVIKSCGPSSSKPCNYGVSSPNVSP